jgi:hypothetical protein
MKNEKNCGESCGCNQALESKKPEEILDPITLPKTQNTKEENKPNPTRFGDWEIKGRAIDF